MAIAHPIRCSKAGRNILSKNSTDAQLAIEPHPWLA
jgi:hypothetical protein